MNYVTEENLNKILQGISKKMPHGIMQDGTKVGHITWQMYLLKDYLKLDGSQLANASIDYKELYDFAVDNNLITGDSTNASLFKYDSENDVLTLPNFMDKSLWSGGMVEEKEAGLPNISGEFGIRGMLDGPVVYSPSGSFDISYATASNINQGMGAAGNSKFIDFDASHSNPIYGNSNTVQPPAIQLIPQIKYTKASTLWETIDIGRFISVAPIYYERDAIFITNKTTITINRTWINIDNVGYVLEGQKIIDLTNADNWDDGQYTVASNRAGKDFYIYALIPVSGPAPKFILSANSTVPTGYTANSSRKIGGFHCLCTSVGTISGHTLSGYLTGDILPLSLWDLKHRAISENEGMVWIPQIGKWVDIYLASWDGTGLASKYGGTIADGVSAPAFHGEKFAEYLGLVKKSLLWRDEFIVVAKGSNEGTNINGSTDPVTTGGHIDTNSRRMISKYGLEDCCGALWQWARDCTEFYPGATWNPTTNQYLAGYAWQESSVYHAGTDSQKYGSCNGLLRRLVLGGPWGDGSPCGSRSAYCNLFSARGGGAKFAGRGTSELRR